MYEIIRIDLNGVNSYLVKCEGGFILFDTGGHIVMDQQFTNRRELLLKELEAAGCSEHNLNLIVLTHGDNDHSCMASYQSIVAAMGLAMLVITLVVIALVLYFVIGSTVIRRKKELGIQKAIGFTTLQLMNQIAVGFAVPVLAGVIIGGFLGAIGTNPMMSVIMRGSGVMKANFIVNPLWVLAFSAATFLFAYLLSLAVTRRIRKISAYALVTE